MELKEVSQATRMSMSEAPQALVEPTRRVVEIALEKLNEHGTVDNLDRQHAVLKNTKTNTIYLLSRVGIEVTRNSKGVVIEIETPLGQDGNGLFVEGLQLMMTSRILKGIDAFQTPQNPNFVTKENIFILRGILPESMSGLADNLKEAEPAGMSHEEYLNMFRKAIKLL